MRDLSNSKTFPHCDQSGLDLPHSSPLISITNRLFFEVSIVLRLLSIDFPNLEELWMGSKAFDESLHTVIESIRCFFSTN